MIDTKSTSSEPVLLPPHKEDSSDTRTEPDREEVRDETKREEVAMNATDNLLGLIFGRTGREVVMADNARPALYGGPAAAGRFDISTRRDRWGKTRPIVIPVHDIHDEPMYHLGDDGEPIEDKDGNRIPVTVPLYNTFLEDDINRGKVRPEVFRFIDISALLRDRNVDEQSLVIKHAIQTGLYEQLLSCKKGNAVDIPVRLLVCSDVEYAKGRNHAFFISPQAMIAYGKALVTSHEVIATGRFRIKVVEEGDKGTADGQTRISVALARELGYEGFGQLQFRLELKGDMLVTGSALVSTLGEYADMVIPVSSFKGGNRPEVGGTYFYKGRIGIMANAAHRNLKIRDNFQVQHYYRDLDWDMVKERADELVGAHRDAVRYLEVVGDTEESESEDFTVTNAVLKAVAFSDSEDAQYVARVLMKHPWLASKVHDFILARYADLAKSANHRFDGAYLACLEDLPDDHAWVNGAVGKEWVFRIPMLSAGNFVKLTMASEDDMWELMNGNPAHDSEIMSAMSNRGSIFVNSGTAKRLNSDFDMDPMCRCPESDPYHVRLDEVVQDWGKMTLVDKDKVRKRSEWNRFGISDAVADFLAAPNIGILTLLQDNVIQREGKRALADAELVGMATQVAVDSHKWTSKLTVDEQSRIDKLIRIYTGRSPFHRNVIGQLRAGDTDWDLEPKNNLDRLVLKVRDAQRENDLGDIMETFKPGGYVGFLGIPDKEVLEEYRPEVLEKVGAYNRSIAGVLTHTKEGSKNRQDAIAEVCEANRMDFAYLRGTMASEEFRDFVRVAWDAAHQSAERSRNQSKASFIFTAGVADIVVECMNEIYGGFGKVARSYGQLRPGEHKAPRVRLFDGWRMYVGKKVDTRKLLHKAFTEEDEVAQKTISKAMDAWLKHVTGDVKVGIRTSYNGRRHTTCLFRAKKIVGDIRTNLIGLGDYEVVAAEKSGVNIIVSLRPITAVAVAVRHKVKVVGLWQDVAGSGSQTEKVGRTVRRLKTATRLASVEIAPGDSGLEFRIKGERIAMVLASSADQSLVLGRVKVVDVQHEEGKASAAVTVDRIAA